MMTSAAGEPRRHAGIIVNESSSPPFRFYDNRQKYERLDEVVTEGAYLEATQSVLQRHGGLWFNDESFVVTRRKA